MGDIRKHKKETTQQWLRRDNQRLAQKREGQRIIEQRYLDQGSVFGARLGLNRDQFAYVLRSGMLDGGAIYVRNKQ